MLKTNFEKRRINDSIPRNMLELLKSSNAMLAGGAITSLFSSSRINDFDIYFRCEGDYECLISLLNDKFKVINCSSSVEKPKKGLKSIYYLGSTGSADTYIYNMRMYQFIHFAFGDMQETVERFDFAHCMGVYDFSSSLFYFNDNFLLSIAQRKLMYNTKCEFPICALIRTSKFVKRGYSLSNIEMLKIALAIQAIDISDYDGLKKQLLGVDTLFLQELTNSLKNNKDKKYEFSEFIDILEAYMFEKTFPEDTNYEL